ncbi:MAG: hypothetical protein RBQ77_05950 [Candidatus Methanomethylophilaceae archaeon]|nr:hypothetical protein [Candidatus Methanomethylophilaceae archaeon]
MNDEEDQNQVFGLTEEDVRRLLIANKAVIEEMVGEEISKARKKAKKKARKAKKKAMKKARKAKKKVKKKARKESEEIFEGLAAVVSDPEVQRQALSVAFDTLALGAAVFRAAPIPKKLRSKLEGMEGAKKDFDRIYCEINRNCRFRTEDPEPPGPDVEKIDLE